MILTYDTTFEEMYLNSAELEKKLKRMLYVPCKSAFGGLGIYKYKYLKDLSYKSLRNTRSDLMEVMCEHVSLNKSINSYGKIYIASKMILWYDKIKTLGDYIVFLIGNKNFIKLWEFFKHKKFK